MSLVESFWKNTSGIMSPIISLYQRSGLFRDTVKTILTGNPDQVCPCSVVHGHGRNCSSVLLKIAQRKPRKLPLAFSVQRKRCRAAAKMILANPELYKTYITVTNDEREKKRKQKWQACDDGLSHLYCLDIGDCIPSWWWKSSCDGPDCSPSCDACS